jgi:acyl-CoA reductase-like NAD-dependent aldehyde dehydrogenase
LILAAVLIGIGLVLWIASFFFPVIGVGLTAARKIIAAIIARFSMVIHKTVALKTVVQKASTTALAAETGLVEAVTRKRVVTPNPKPNP